RRAHRAAVRADRARRRPRPLLQRRGGPRLRPHRPRRHQRARGRRCRPVTAPLFDAVTGPMAGSMIAPVTGRYVLPSYVERTSYGRKESNPYNKLYEERIVFLGAPVDDPLANDVIAQLIALGGMAPDGVISLYITSPGGSLTAMTAIYDTMQFIKPEVE